MIMIIMREFGMNMAYGPCIGCKLGLNPPKEVENLLIQTRFTLSRYRMAVFIVVRLL